MKKTAYYLWGHFFRFRAGLGHGLGRSLGLALASLFFMTAVPAFGQDFSEAYEYGGRIHVPAPESSGGEEILDISGGAEAGGILGCSGLSLDGMVDAQLGGIGGDKLSEGLANAAQTALFREMLTRTMANPQVASVLKNIQGTVNARVSMLQERCNAREIFADATNKRLQDEAMQRCVAEEKNMEICQRVEKREEYVEETIESDKWQKGLQEHICEGGAEEGCDWLSLVPDFKTAIENTNPDAASSKALMDGLDLRNMATGYAVEMINNRVEAAEKFVSRLGYAKAMEAALHNEPGLPPHIEESLASASDAGDDIDVTQLYTLYDHTNNTACHFSVERGMQTNMSPVMDADGGGDVVFPIAGANVNNAEITSLFGPRTRPCKGCSTFYSGVGFGHASGTGVLSSIDGIVRYTGFSGCGGKKIIIEGDGVQLTYFHLSQITPNIYPGKPVSAGDTIGQVGDTGTCTKEPHLRFTVKRNGALIDPLPWLGGGDDEIENAVGEEDGYGLTSMAASRIDEDADETFVVDAHKKSAQLGARLANTVRCNISKTLHPQMFVRMALMTGTTGPYSRGDLVSESASNRQIVNALASGDKGAFIHGLGKVYGQHAAVSTYSATINEMAARIATVSTGKGGMNKPLYNRARAELGRLKFERYQIIQKYNIECKAAERLSKAMDDRNARIDRATNSGTRLRGVMERPLQCGMFEDITSDGLDEIIRYATETDEDVERMRQRSEQ